MKRILSLLLAITLLAGLCPVALAASPNGFLTAAVYNYDKGGYDDAREMPLVNLRLDGKSIVGEMPSVILGERTMVPLRLIAEGLGATVTWLNEEQQVLVVRGGRNILLTLGSATALVNGKSQTLPDEVPATLISYKGQGYTMVPVRFFSESLDCQVDWVQASYTATVDQPTPAAGETTTGQVTTGTTSDLLAPLDKPVDPQSRIIAIDAGHGGSASGAYYEKTMEKDLTLSMSKKLESILKALGYQTVMTRSDDSYVGLYERCDIANEADADVFVSIHCNAAENAPDFQGLYVYHHRGSSSGKEFAQYIQEQVCAFTGAVDRKINSANFVVVRETTMPAVLVETGFMTCHAELTNLKDDAYQTRMAQGIAQGLIKYLNDHPKKAAPSETPSDTPSEAPTDGQAAPSADPSSAPSADASAAPTADPSASAPVEEQAAASPPAGLPAE